MKNGNRNHFGTWKIKQKVRQFMSISGLKFSKFLLLANFNKLEVNFLLILYLFLNSLNEDSFLPNFT